MDGMQALKDAQAARAEAEQDADMIQAQLQQAQAEGSSKPGALDPPSTPPAPRRTLSGQKASASGLQVCTNGFQLHKTFLDIGGHDNPCNFTVMPGCCVGLWWLSSQVSKDWRGSCQPVE